MRSLLADLAAQPAPDDEEYIHPLLRRREIKKAEIVVITPDRGLTGGLHSRINRVVGEFILERQKEGVETSVVAVGRKGRDFLVRTGQDVRAVFSDLGDRPELEDVRPIATLVNDEYSEERVDAVYLAYADFVSTVTQRPVVQPLLPVVPAELEYKDMVGYIYEPDPLTVMAALLPRFVDMQVYHAVLESVASEQSARMVATAERDRQRQRHGCRPHVGNEQGPPGVDHVRVAGHRGRRGGRRSIESRKHCVSRRG